MGGAGFARDGRSAAGAEHWRRAGFARDGRSAQARSNDRLTAGRPRLDSRPLPGGPHMEVKTLAVVGAGQMGAGIAQVAAQSGLSVVLVDVGAELLQKGLAGIRAQLDRASSKGKIRADEAEAALVRLRGASSAQEASHAQFAVEAVTENEAVKKKV